MKGSGENQERMLTKTRVEHPTSGDHHILLVAMPMQDAFGDDGDRLTD